MPVQFGPEYPPEYDEPTYCLACGKEDWECECEDCPGCGEFGNPECCGKEGHFPDKPRLCWSVADLVRETYGEIMGEADAWRMLKRRLFKDTSSGCCARLIEGGQDHAGAIKVAGYVEGWDGECRSYRVNFPFSEQSFWSAVDAADRDARDIWDDTHGCDDCKHTRPPKTDLFDLDPEFFRPIDPDCKSCGGSGEII